MPPEVDSCSVDHLVAAHELARGRPLFRNAVHLSMNIWFGGFQLPIVIPCILDAMEQSVLEGPFPIHLTVVIPVPPANNLSVNYILNDSSSALSAAFDSALGCIQRNARLVSSVTWHSSRRPTYVYLCLRWPDLHESSAQCSIRTTLTESRLCKSSARQPHHTEETGQA